jgi:tRNA dimethylallyltransferase
LINSIEKKNKVLVILGQTATGKSNLAVKLAQKYNGEVISADSRQVYTGLDIGTGKITKKEMRGVPHHMLDVVSPKKVFTVTEWKEQAEKKIADIISRDKLPIICGGTAFYIKSLTENIVLPEVPPNKELRKKLEKKTLVELQDMLKKLDQKRFAQIDTKNPVRLVRAIEIATALGKVPKIKKQKNKYEFLHIGLKLPEANLKKKIHIRLFARIRDGMVAEVKKLHENGLSWKRMGELGLEYRYLALLIQNKISKTEFTEKLETEIWHFAKRQMQWWKRDSKIKWFNPKDAVKIQKEVDLFTHEE